MATEKIVFVIRLPWWVWPLAAIWLRVLWVAHVTCPHCIDLDMEADRFSGWVARRVVARVKVKADSIDA